jgi:hypothetical protein
VVSPGISVAIGDVRSRSAEDPIAAAKTEAVRNAVPSGRAAAVVQVVVPAGGAGRIVTEYRSSFVMTNPRAR